MSRFSSLCLCLLSAAQAWKIGGMATNLRALHALQIVPGRALSRTVCEGDGMQSCDGWAPRGEVFFGQAFTQQFETSFFVKTVGKPSVIPNATMTFATINESTMQRGAVVCELGALGNNIFVLGCTLQPLVETVEFFGELRVQVAFDQLPENVIEMGCGFLVTG